MQRIGLWSRPGERVGRVCRLDRHGVARTVLPDVGRPNGMAFSPDARKLYVTDSARQRILALEYDRGSLGPPVVLVDTSGMPGTPDGLVTDESGCLWSARNRAGEIIRYDPQGHIMARMKLPVTGVTSLCFGGEDGTDLYLTSAAGRRTSEAAAGGIFRLPVGVRGTPVFAAELSGKGSDGG